jgi:magnesium transporter
LKGACVPKTLLPIHELEFEAAGEHHTRRVPIARPDDLVEATRAGLLNQRFDSAAEIVVCDADERLMGLVNIEDLLAADGNRQLAEIMDPAPPVVTAGVDQEIAAWQAILHGETSLSVVDHDGRFQGLITPRRIFEVLLWEHDEDTARTSGVLQGSAQARSVSGEPISRRLRHRLPWVLLGVVGALVSAELVAAFESTLQAQVVLAFFIPGIVYLADAVGTQTETLVIRGMSVGIPVEKVFWRESITGALMGIVLAAICLPLVVLRWGQTDVALAVSIALFGACSVASVVATALPWSLRRLGQDPAFAAGPVATVIQDLLSVLVYLEVCRAIL